MKEYFSLIKERAPYLRFTIILFKLNYILKMELISLITEKVSIIKEIFAKIKKKPSKIKVGISIRHSSSRK